MLPDVSAMIAKSRGILQLTLQGNHAAHEAVNELSPTQYLPPLEGGGLLHCLLLILRPRPPQVFEHGLQLSHRPQFPFTEQGLVLQGISSTASPGHCLPPLDGRGLEQDL